MRSLNGWQRIGVVLSASWFMLVTTFFGTICGRSLLETNFAALWGVETATARAQRPSSPPASDDSFKGMFDDIPITKPPQAAPRRADPYVGLFAGVPDAANRENTSRPSKSKGMFDDPIPQASPPLQPEPKSARNLFDNLPDIATGSVQSTAGAYDDLIPQKGMSRKGLQETGFWYCVLTSVPIALLWALGYTIAWIVAGFRTDRHEAET